MKRLLKAFVQTVIECVIIAAIVFVDVMITDMLGFKWFTLILVVLLFIYNTFINYKHEKRD